MAHNAFGKRLLSSGKGLQQTLSPLAQRRCHSTKAVPSFTPTSSLELDQKLNHIRQDLFVPMYFSEHQKRLIFRDRYRERLNQEQVKITIANEEFTLQPRHRQSLPSKREVHQAVELMKTSQDWKNFVPLLIGSHHAKYKSRPENFDKWVRLAGQADALAYILEAAKQSARTGFTFAHRSVAFRFAYQLHKKAESAGFKGEQVITALRYAEQAAQLMERPEHTNPDISQDAKRQPFFIAVLTELSAARSINETNGIDVDDKVVSYLKRLLATWDLAALDRAQSNWYETDELLREISLLYSGLKWAQQVNDVAQDKELMKTIAQRLKQLEDIAAPAVESAPQKIKQNPTLGFNEVKAIL